LAEVANMHPATRRHYASTQWKRLIEIAGEILGYKLKGKKAKFLNFRHTDASDIAQRCSRCSTTRRPSA
jgi:hypothetical protein